MVRARFQRTLRTALLLVFTLLVAGCGSLQWPAPPTPTTVPAPAVPQVAPPSPSTAAAVPAPQAKSALPTRPAAPPDAVPRVENIKPGHPNQPYEIRGERFEPANTDVPMREVGVASWYGHPFHGRRTANGERYNMHAMTAAHPTMPLPSYVRVRHLANGREVVVRVNDRGPFRARRIIDLSHAAAQELGISGIAQVEVVRLTHDDIRSGAWRQDSKKALARKPPASRDVAVAQQDVAEPTRLAK
jgi:rare lipoprotein A